MRPCVAAHAGVRLLPFAASHPIIAVTGATESPRKARHIPPLPCGALAASWGLATAATVQCTVSPHPVSHACADVAAAPAGGSDQRAAALQSWCDLAVCYSWSLEAVLSADAEVIAEATKATAAYIEASPQR